MKALDILLLLEFSSDCLTLFAFRTDSWSLIMHTLLQDNLFIHFEWVKKDQLTFLKVLQSNSYLNMALLVKLEYYKISISSLLATVMSSHIYFSEYFIRTASTKQEASFQNAWSRKHQQVPPVNHQRKSLMNRPFILLT